jgi:hypothetical protein
MSASSAEGRELLELIHRSREEGLAPHERNRIHDLVKADAAAREMYVGHMLMAAAIRWSHQSFDPVALGLKTELEPTNPQRAVATTSWLPVVLRNTSQRSPLILSRLAIAAVFYAVFAGLAWNLRPNARSSSTSATTSTLAMDASSTRMPATLTETTNCTWASSRPITVGAPLRADELLDLVAGSAQIKFADGAVVQLQGPAQFVVEQFDRGRLHRGKLVARVPREAIGFSINTPSAHVVDLGTEFGVEVNRAGETAVQVFEGLVELSPASSGPLQQLRAGQAARTKGVSQSLVALDFVPNKFIRPSATQKKPTDHISMIDLSNCSATQSSQLSPWGAALAIDGDPSTACHTAMDDAASWLKIDLKQPRLIAAVALLNRDSCRGTLRDITIKVLTVDGQTVVAQSRELNPRNVLADEDDFEAGPAHVVFDIVGTQGAPVIGQLVLIERKPCVVDASKLSAVQRGKFGASLDACANSLVLSEVQVFELPAVGPRVLATDPKP